MVHPGIRRKMEENGEDRGASPRTGPGTTLTALDATWLHRRVRRTLPWSTLGPDIDLFVLMVHVVERRLSVQVGRTEWVAGKCKGTNAARALPIAPGQ